MTQIFHDFAAWFWSPSFWLPANITWSHLEPYNRFDIRYNLFYPIYVAIGLIIIRTLFEKFIARPIGRALNVKDNRDTFLLNSQLEVYYKQNCQLSESIYLHVAREVHMNVDEVKRWFALRRKSDDRPSKMKKFTEGCWRFVFYLFIWIYGLHTIYSKSWTWDTSEFWRGYPNHPVSDDIYWYYTLELGVNFSLLTSQFFDVKRKDFWQMFVHHVLCVILFFFSFACNFHRVMASVICILDSSDFLLELAKLANYLKAKTFCNIVFAGFVLVWIFSRIVIFPTQILYKTTLEGHVHLGGIYPAYAFMNALLWIIQGLNLIWLYMICGVVYRAIFSVDGLDKDDRSESEPDSADHIDSTNDTDKNK